jgi:hypothetical protein
MILVNKYSGCESRRMRWAGHVAHMEDRRGTYRVLVGRLRERGHLEDPGIDGSLKLKWIFRNRNGDMDWIELAQNS